MKKSILCLLTGLMLASCNDKPEMNPAGRGTVYVYPNPASSYASIEVQNPALQSYTLLVFNSKGEKVLQRTVDPGRQRYDLPLRDQPKGNYQVIVNTPTSVIRQKFVKV